MCYVLHYVLCIPQAHSFVTRHLLSTYNVPDTVPRTLHLLSLYHLHFNEIDTIIGFISQKEKPGLREVV